MTADDQLAAIEADYLRARSARDRLDVARVTGDTPDIAALEEAATDAAAVARAALLALDAALAQREDADALGPEDRRALDAIRAGLDALAAGGEDPAGDAGPLVAAYAAAAADLPFEGRHLTRRQVLLELASEPDPHRRRALFAAFEPLWHAVDGDGADRSPYRDLVARSAVRWRDGHSPIEANAVALGVTVEHIEDWAVATLEAWREAYVESSAGPARPTTPIEPWDWWWLAGEAHRRLSPALPAGVGAGVNRAVFASLGADLDALGIRFDLEPHPGRAEVPVAFATFDGRPHRLADGTWSPAHPTILATCTSGGLDELVELVHETGHAIHLAGIRTRPAFADWPDSDALTEAIGELVSLDVVEPAWQRRWLPGSPSVPLPVAIRGRYAEVAMDAAWALLEIRLHADPSRRPNDVWAEITGRWLGIAPHPEWSWWAMRGQLVEEPGYMANYAIGAVLATDLRAAIRSARGDWTDSDPGWYAWVREHLFRFGLERTTRDVLRDLLGRAPSADALLAEIGRGRTA